MATAEVGALSFKLGPEFKVIDQLGLTSPGVAKKIIEGDMRYPYFTWNPKYVIVSWDGKYTPYKSDWFNKEYSAPLQVMELLNRVPERPKMCYNLTNSIRGEPSHVNVRGYY